jgi:hypothetical protein
MIITGTLIVHMFQHEICFVLICKSAFTMFYCSEASGLMTSDGADTAKSAYQSTGFGNSFPFKFEDLNGRVHRFNCGKYLGRKLGRLVLILFCLLCLICYKNLQLFILLFFLGTEHLDELVSAVMQRVDINDREYPAIVVCFMLVQILLP